MYELKIPMPPTSAKAHNREPLKPGTIIKDKSGMEYVIQDDEVNFGGSSIVYKVLRPGVIRKLVLKECYPYSEEYAFSRRQGVVQAQNAKSEKFLSKMKDKLIHENEIGQMILSNTGRAIAAWGDLDVKEISYNGQTYDATGSCFILMELASDGKKRGWFLNDLLEECSKPVSKGAPLRNGGSPSPYVATCVVEELLKSLSKIHSAGYIHGDIQDGNFFLMDYSLERGDIGIG